MQNVIDIKESGIYKQYFVYWGCETWKTTIVKQE